MKLTGRHGFFGFLTFIFSCQAYGQWAGEITLASDYLFNGVSQTQEKAAIQAGLRWTHNNGFYLGSWASNIDYGELAKLEVDFYAGYYKQVNDKVSFDLGVSQYSYWRGDNNSQANYAEVYGKLHYGQTSLATWYAWDYFGTGANHYIVKASHSFALTEELSLLIALDKSTSLDSNKWQWQANDDSYIHGEVSASYSYRHFNFSLGLHSTDLDDTGDTKLLFTVSRPFG